MARAAAVLALSLLLPTPLFARAAPPPPGDFYTPQEIAMLAVLDRTSGQPTGERQAALSALAGTAGFDSPDGRALLLLEQCSEASLSGEDAGPYIAGLDALVRAVPDHAFLPLAQLDCELHRQRQHGDTAGSFEARSRLYLASARIAFPLVRYRLASSYAHEALAMGFVDEALQAVQIALRIAEANDDAPYRRDSLMDLALIRSDMNQHAEAVRGSETALGIADGNRRVDLLLNHGYILARADRPQDALEVYQRARNMAREGDDTERELTAMLNLSGIHVSLGQVDENLALTAEALAIAERMGNDYFKGYAAMTHAIALMDDGGAEERAIALFKEGRELMERAGERAHVAANLVIWADRMARGGHHAEAYRALADSRTLEAEMRSAERERNAQYLSAVLGAGQKDLAIERLRRENEVAQLQIEKRRLGTAAWTIGLASVSLVALTLLLSLLRLRRSSRRLAAANARLDHENAHDSLTGLHNRAYFVRRFEALKVATPGRAVLALLDLDHFKQINDRFGHIAGDEVLKEAARRLSSAVRGQDLIARWGGEEFIILASGLDEGRRGADLAARLLDVLAAAPVQVGNEALPLTGSIGFAEIDLGPGTRLGDELEYVDAALYHAKREGRNRAVAVAEN